MMGLAGKFIDFFELQREPDGGAGVAWWFRARFLILFDTLYAWWKIRAGGNEWIMIRRFQIHRAVPNRYLGQLSSSYVDLNANLYSTERECRQTMLCRDSLASVSGP